MPQSASGKELPTSGISPSVSASETHAEQPLRPAPSWDVSEAVERDQSAASSGDPYIGQIVIYHDGQGREHPAIVRASRGDDFVDVSVFGPLSQGVYERDIVPKGERRVPFSWSAL